METKRITFYFDGFNFYNGLKDISKVDTYWKKFYWIDFKLFCSQFVDSSQVIKQIKYFTAAPLNLDKQKRWAVLMAVNKSLNPGMFVTVSGKYYKKKMKCPLCHGVYEMPEEKRTDVNISVQLIADCVLNLTDVLVLVSADSDLVPSLEFIKKNFPQKRIKVFFPPYRKSKDIENTVGHQNIRFLEKSLAKFEKSVMPETVEVLGKKFTMPINWK